MEKFLELINKLRIFLEGEEISGEKVLRVERDFIASSFASEEHTTSIVLHTGSVCYEVVAFVLICLAEIIFDEASAEDIISDLPEQSIVTYKNKRWIYCGKSHEFEEVKYVLKSDVNGTMYLPESRLCEVVPYNGESTSLNGKGMGKSKAKRISFLREVLEYKDSDISPTVEQSVIVYMDNRKLDYFLNNIRIEVNDKSYDLLDLVTVSYFTESIEVKKRGNANNNEPMIKVTSSISKMRELVKNKGGNKVFGALVLDEKAYIKYGLDLEEIMYRKRMPFSLIVSKIKINDWIVAQLNSENKINLLPFTNEILKAINPSLENENSLISKKLFCEVKSAENGNCRPVYIKSGPLKWRDYQKVKTDIAFIINNCYEDPAAIQFARWSYSILKVYENAIFTMEEYEQLQQKYQSSNVINGVMLEANEYMKTIPMFPVTVQKKAEQVLDYVIDIHEKLYANNPKREEYRGMLRDLVDSKLLVVVPSMKYKPYVERFYPKKMETLRNRYSVVTESKASTEEIYTYSDVIYLSIMNYTKYNPFDMAFLVEANILINETQAYLFRKLHKEFLAFKKLLNDSAAKSLDLKTVYEEQIANEEKMIEVADGENELQNEESLDYEINDSLMRLFVQNERFVSAKEYGENDDAEERFQEAYRFGQFATGENIIFTRGYTAYVIDKEKGSVIEKNVDDLKEGEQLIFTVNDDRTKDIVDELLNGVAEMDSEIMAAYSLVHGWKRNCRMYKSLNGLTYNDITKKLRLVGLKTQPQVIRGWIDAQSHIVGPKNEDAFVYLKKVFGDTCFNEESEAYALATKRIRSVRTRILKMIEKVVISEELNQKNEIQLFEGMQDKIKEITIVKQLERIEDIEPFKIPGYRANKPVEG
ncbi:MAG: DrmE family protein [Eubacteriales bacterium]|nr:DrmE family protein [Eubacteriales bacterium]